MFEAHVTIEPQRAVLVLEGELDFGEQPRVRAAIDSIGDAQTLVVDLSRLTFMDTSGAHLLLDTRDRCRRLLVVRGPASVHRSLAALDLEREFEFVDEPTLI